MLEFTGKIMSLGLVAYGASSDEDSDVEMSEDSPQVQLIAPVAKATQSTSQQRATNEQPIRTNLSLPKPTTATHDIEDDDGLKMNLPKPSRFANLSIEEEDDEFLHKKVDPSLVQRPIVKPPNKRQPVKITIPSLSEYDDAKDTKRERIATVQAEPKKPSGLLGMLPVPKSSMFLGKSQANNNTKSSTTIETKKSTPLIPHSVSNRLKQPTKTTPQTEKSKAKASKLSLLGAHYVQSDDSDDSDAGDFFSLNQEEKLPEVSASEISAMVASKAAKMAQVARSLQGQNTDASVNGSTSTESYVQSEYADARPSSSSKLIAQQRTDIEALCGVRAAKRARKEDIQFIEISQDQVTLNQDEWARNQLQAETEYQPRGLLNDPGAGTKKKHQITYLAYQAKANEQELQAMWAANRHAKRQTQSKYGF